MAIPALEYREQLLAQGCEEGLADAVLSLVEAARDDAEAQVIMKVGERIAHTEQQLAEHAEQFRTLESAIRESAAETTRTLTAQLEQQTAETNQQIAELKQQTAQIEQQTAETNQRLAETNQQVAELKQQTAQIEQQTAETNQRVADLNQRVTEQLGDLKVWVAEQLAEMKVQIAEQETKNEQRFTRMQGRLLQGAIGIAGLIIGATAAIIAAIAFLG